MIDDDFLFPCKNNYYFVLCITKYYVLTNS